MIVAPAIGPTLGGVLVEYTDWRFIFFINIPIGVLGVVAAAMVLREEPGHPDRPLDVLGFLTIAEGCSRCCWPSRRARTGDGRATRS